MRQMSDSPDTWMTRVLAGLDRSGPVPLYFQVAQTLEDSIRNGTIPVGSRLENEISIGERLGLSRPTVRRAIQELVDKGLVVRRRGVGTQVVQGQVSRPVELTSLYEDLQQTGHEPSTRVLACAVVPAPEDAAAALGIEPGDEALHLHRTRSADGAPVAILVNYLPIRFADLSVAQLEDRGLYEQLRGRGVAIRIASQRIGARIATDEESELLGIAAGEAVLTMERVAYDDSGQAVEAGYHCYRPDRYWFETTVVAK